MKPLEDLAAEVPPMTDEVLPECEVTMQVRKLLEELERRLVSFQWDVTEEVHRRIMDALWSEFGEQEEMRETNVGRVSAWRTEDLRNACPKDASITDG